jgi:hypothetical protein
MATQLVDEWEGTGRVRSLAASERRRTPGGARRLRASAT